MFQQTLYFFYYPAIQDKPQICLTVSILFSNGCLAFLDIFVNKSNILFTFQQSFPNVVCMPQFMIMAIFQHSIGRTCTFGFTIAKTIRQFTKGGIRIFKMFKWVMDQNTLGNTALYLVYPVLLCLSLAYPLPVLLLCLLLHFL